MGKMVVFANQKGGVGKTTSAVNIGSCIAQMGKRVLLVDFDPQGNLSSNVGADNSQNGIYEVITGKSPIADVVQKTVQENLSVISSNIDLAGANVELVDQEDREYYLKTPLQTIQEDWDYIFIDCPPSLGILTINGLSAAEFVIIPLQCEYFALEGLSLLLKTIQKVQNLSNSELQIAGIMFTMYDTRTRLSREVVEEVTKYFKDKVFRTIIPRNIRLSEAPSHSVPIALYDAECIGARSYANIAGEVVNRV